MSEIQLYQRSELPPSGPRQALIPMSLADNSGAIQLGNAINQVSTDWMGKILKAQRETEISNASVAIQNQKTAYDKWLTDNPDQANDEMHNATQFTKMFGPEFKSQLLQNTKNKDAQHIVGLNVNEYSASFREHAQKQAGAMVTQQNADALQNNLELAILNKNPEAAAKIIKIGRETNVIGDDDKAEMILRDATQKIALQTVQDDVASYKMAYASGDVTSLTTEEVSKGITTLDKAREITQKAKGLDEEKRQAMLANIDSYQSQIDARAKKNEYDYDVKTTQDFAQKITNKELTPDDIESLNLSTEMKKKWLYDPIGTGTKANPEPTQGYLNNSFKPAPTQATPEGFAVLKKVIINSANKTMGKLDAYDALFDARYNQGSITDDQLKQGIEKIEHPYPKSVANMIYDAMEDRPKYTAENIFTSKWEGGIFGFGGTPEKNLKKDELMLNWVDDELAKNPNRSFSPKELYQMKAEIGATVQETPMPSTEVPTAESLRQQNTEEAYNKGVELGYWE